MNRFSALASGATSAALLLVATAAQADTVVVLPARGQVPGRALTGTIAYESRYVMIELGHKLVDETETAAAMSQVPDGQPDNADEYAIVARDSKATWVVVPTIIPAGSRYRLELTAYEVSGGRVESVARDIDTELVHQQIVEMAKLLLRPEGVGTGALPWERGAPPAGAATSTPEADQREPGATTTGMTLFAGAGLGVSAALVRPDGATGSSTATFGALRAGVGLGPSLELGLGFRGHFSGPRAVDLDGSARYMFELDSSKRLRIGPELGVGAFVQQGGAKQTDLLLRFNAVASMSVAGPVSVDAAVGDLTWVPASGGTLVLAGGALYGVARF